MLLATSKTIREIDRHAEKVQGIKSEILMQNAGLSAAKKILESLDSTAFVVVLCGKGKNGGDGYVIASELWEYRCEVVVFESESDSRDDASEHHRAKLKRKTKNVHPITKTDALRDACERADIIVDALFGVGFHGEMPDAEGRAIEIANASGARKIAVDIPSGVNADDGCAACVSFRADTTLCMAYLKRGMLLYPGREYCGNTVVCDIGIDKNEAEKNVTFSDMALGDEEVREYVLSRPADSHKGTFGRLMLICGSDSMTGAAVLACEGALRMGVGLCELVCTRRVAEVVGARCPEVVFTIIEPLGQWDESVYEKIVLHSVDADAIVIGCGMGQHEQAEKLIRLLSSISGCPMLLDADALNSLDGRVRIIADSKRQILVTPHPKEFARLVFCDIEEVLKNKFKVARRLSDGCSINVLLKGASTIVCAAGGMSYINTTGNSGLAKGGSGDVLSGMIGALLARGIEAGMAGALGAYVHGAAADLLASELSEVGMLPRDLPSAAARYLSRL